MIHYKGNLLAGVDEVGRGPLAGDVVAAAVILDQEHPIEGLTDSKKLSEKKREFLFEEIHDKSKSIAVGRASVAEIDQYNILNASLLAMKRAVDGLSVVPEYVVVDGNRLPDWSYKSQSFIKGDLLIDCISAASIIAKVTRDREMVALAKQFPAYQFDRHKGYPTVVHLEAIRSHGVTSFHRRSFAPVKKVLDLAEQ